MREKYSIVMGRHKSMFPPLLIAKRVTNESVRQYSSKDSNWKE